MITVKDLQDFEEDIADIFSQGKIKAPVHLRKGREEYLINVFRDNNIGDNDYVYGYWDSHELALLRGVPKEEVKEQVLRGNSIALCFPDYNVLCSGIVGSLMGVATGTAWAVKEGQECSHCVGSPQPSVDHDNILYWCNHCSNERKIFPQVYHFCGDMSAETGIFHESVKYAHNFDLPIKFVVCDNGLSVMTDTRAVWNDPEPWFIGTKYVNKIIYFRYINGYPHSGLGKKIEF